MTLLPLEPLQQLSLLLQLLLLRALLMLRKGLNQSRIPLAGLANDVVASRYLAPPYVMITHVTHCKARKARVCERMQASVRLEQCCRQVLGKLLNIGGSVSSSIRHMQTTRHDIEYFVVLKNLAHSRFGFGVGATVGPPKGSSTMSASEIGE